MHNFPDTTAAKNKWGDIKEWDTSFVTSFLYAFSYNRDQAGGTSVAGGNEKAKVFTADLSKWITSAVTDMGWMFNVASVFNSDISK